METPFSSFRMEWAVGEHRFSNESLNAAYPDSDIQWFNYPSSVGQAGFSSLKLSSGMSLHRSRFKFASESKPALSPVASVDVVYREPTLVIQAVFSGKTSRRDFCDNASWCFPYTVDLQQTLVKVESESRFELTFDATSDIEVVYLHANASSLQLLLGSALSDKLLTDIINQSQPTQQLPTQVLSPLKFCFDGHLKGPLLKAHAQFKAMEFLTALVKMRAGHLQSARVSKDARAQAIRDHITACGLNLPNSQTLSRMFGLTPRTLNAAFVDAYGMTVARYVKEHRLMIAHEELTISDVTIREVAAKIGYSQVSNFSAAFKSFFGYAPTTLRLKPISKER